MTIIVRKLTAGQAWFDFKIAQPETPVDNFPPSILSEFIPRPIDKGWLSCFCVETATPDNLIKIAAAMSLLSEDRNKAQYFIGVLEDDLIRSSVKIRKTKGGTFHNQVDDCHVEINIPTITDLDKVVRIFWAGDPIQLKGVKIGENAAFEARLGRIGFQAALSGKPVSRTHERYLIDFVKDGHLWAHGSTDVERCLVRKNDIRGLVQPNA